MSDTLNLAVRRVLTDRTLRRWTFAWGGASVLGIVNGAIRELAFKERVGA